MRVLSGEASGIGPSLMRCGLASLTPLYRCGIGWRNRRFDRALKRADPSVVRRAGIPVISIGNLTTGGTGKTPHVVAVARFLRSVDRRVVVVSRGYTDPAGSSSASTQGRSRNDEAMELEDRLPDVPHLQDADRFRMIEIAVEELDSEIAVLDDGFQHRQLARDLDVVLIDATLPFGYGRLLPRGLLREPIGSLRRADLVVLTRVDQVDAQRRIEIRNRIAQAAPGIPCIQSRMAATGARSHSGRELTLAELVAVPTFAVCGIGNPDNFFRSLKQLAMDIVGRRADRDHYDYQREDLDSIAAAAREAGASQIVCTHKDLVKLGVDRVGGLPLWALQIDVEWMDGFDTLRGLLESVVAAESGSS